MSIKPVSFNAETQMYTILHEEEDHTFEISIADINYSVDHLGATDWSMFGLICPIDGYSTWHPVSGGDATLPVQTLAVNLIVEKSCPCGTLTDITEEIALAHSKLHCGQMDGLEHWAIAANKGPVEDIIFDSETTYVVGVGPIDETAVPSTYNVVGVDEILLAVVLKSTFTKYSSGKVTRAEKPSAASSD